MRRGERRALGLAILLLSGALRAEAPPPADWFFAGPQMNAAALSPDGRRLAAITRAPGQTAALSVYDLDDTIRARQVARFDAANVASFVWASNQRLLLQVSEGNPDDHRPRRLAPLYSVAPDGSDLKVLSWTPGLAGVTAGPRRRAVVQPLRLDHMYEPEAVEVHAWEPDSGKWQRLDADAPPRARQWWLRPDGTPEWVATISRGRYVLHRRDSGSASESSWRRVAEHDPLDPPWQPRHVDREGRLWVTRPHGPARVDVLTRLNPDTGEPLPETLLSTPGFDVVPVFVSDPDSGELLGVRTVTDAELTVWFHPRLRALQQRIDERLEGRINRLACVRCTQDDAVLLVTSWSDSEPGEYWVLNVADDRLRPVSRRQTLVDPTRMARRSFHRIRSRDGRDLPVWITALPQPQAAPRPAVVLVHGGPSIRGAQWKWEAMAQFLATRGHVVIEPEFRGSAGYGAAHEQAGWKQWGLAMQDDLADALHWAVAQGLVRRDRACIAGGSYGGYAALMAPLRDPGLWRCAAAWAAVTDPRLLYRSSWGSRLTAEQRSLVLPRVIGDRWHDSGQLEDAAVQTHAERLNLPLLLAYGRLDGIVSIDHGSRLLSALRSHGHDPEYVVYDYEGHGWLRPDTWLDFAGRLERFLDRNLR